MTIDKKQHAALLEAAKPLIKWLCENTHPHAQVTVDCTSVTLVEQVAHGITEEYLKD